MPLRVVRAGAMLVALVVNFAINFIVGLRGPTGWLRAIEWHLP